MRVYLDDERIPKVEQFDKVIRSYENFEREVLALAHYGAKFTYISFDHDLGLGKTGYDCAKFLVDADISANILHTNFKFNVHSANPVGAENIRSYLSNYLRSRSSTG